MSSLFKFFCGNCVFSENFPKASFSTNISMKNDYKLPISSMQSLNFRFNILLANNKEVIILKKSIFRILALITQSFYNKKGLLETNKKRSSVFINKSKNSLNINNLLQSKQKKTKGNNELIQGLDIQILMKMEKDFFSNEKVLQKFIEGFEKSNLIIFYSSSFLTMILKRLVFSLNKINFINLLKIFEKCDFGIEACLRKDLQTTCSNKSECLLWNAKQIININCEITFLDLLEYKGFQNGKFRCLEPENIRELIEFITSILEKSNICVIFIPNDSYIEDFVEIFDEVLINTEIQRKFDSYMLEIEGIYYENELEFISLKFKKNKEHPIKKQIYYVNNILLEDFNKRKSHDDLIFFLEKIISRLGLRRTLHYIYETESLQKFETKSIALFQLLRKILYENLISYEEALQIQNFQLFNIIENIDLECQLQQYMQKLLDSPIIIRNNLELSSFSNSSSKSVLAYGKEENCKIENLQKQSQIKENNISVDISENLSQFSFSDYSLQKS